MKAARVIILALVLGVAALAGATVARGSARSTWYWEPSLCKSKLTHGGVQIGSGANAPAFSVAASYCLGQHNRCWLTHGKRLYKVFKVTVLSDDGVVRAFNMIVTGKESWTGSVGRIVARGVTPNGFARVYGAAAHAAAVRENALGCTDPTG